MAHGPGAQCAVPINTGSKPSASRARCQNPPLQNALTSFTLLHRAAEEPGKQGLPLSQNVPQWKRGLADEFICSFKKPESLPSPSYRALCRPRLLLSLSLCLLLLSEQTNEAEGQRSARAILPHYARIYSLSRKQAGSTGKQHSLHTLSLCAHLCQAFTDTGSTAGKRKKKREKKKKKQRERKKKKKTPYVYVLESTCMFPPPVPCLSMVNSKALLVS